MTEGLGGASSEEVLEEPNDVSEWVKGETWKNIAVMAASPQAIGLLPREHRL